MAFELSQRAAPLKAGADLTGLSHGLLCSELKCAPASVQSSELGSTRRLTCLPGGGEKLRIDLAHLITVCPAADYTSRVLDIGGFPPMFHGRVSSATATTPPRRWEPAVVETFNNTIAYLKFLA